MDKNIYPKLHWLKPGLSTTLTMIILFALYLLSQSNFLLFHSIAELFSVSIGLSVFLLVWNTRRMINDNVLLMLGITYAFVGILDLMHLLSYKGMGVFSADVSANHATQLWISARLLESIGLFIYSLAPRFRLKAWSIFSLYIFTCALLLASIFKWHVFPICYVDGQGLTNFKVLIEYFIISLLTLSVGLIFRRRSTLDPAVYALMVAAMIMTVMTELVFTFYIGLYGISNILGHALKILSFILVYNALVRASLAKPFETLFRDIEDEKEAAKESERHLSALIENLPGLAYSASYQSRRTMLFLSEGCYTLTGYSGTELLNNQSVDYASIIHPDDIEATSRQIDTALNQQQPFEVEYRIITAQGLQKYICDKGVGIYERSEVRSIEGFISDISNRKREETLNSINAKLLDYSTKYNYADFLEKILDEGEILTGSDIGFFHLVEEDQETLTLQAWSTNTRENMCKSGRAQIHYPISKAGVWVDCVHERRPVIHNSYETLPRKKGMPEGHATIIRELVVPVIRGGLITAIVGFGNKITNYDDNDVQLIQSLADSSWELVVAKRSQEALHASQNRLRQAQLVAKIGSWSWDMVTGQINWSNEMYNIYGIEQGVIPENGLVRELVHPDDLMIFDNAMQLTDAGKIPERISYRIRPTNNSVKWVQALAEPECDASGKTIYMMGTAQDITQHKQAEEKIMKSSALLQSIYDTIPDAIVTTDIDRNIVSVNRGFENTFGFTLDEVAGKQTSVLYESAEEFSRQGAARFNLTAKEQFVPYVVNYRKKSGELIPGETVGIPIQNHHGERIGFLSVIKDITARLQLESQVLQAHKLEAVGTMVSGIAHELNNILQSMFLYGGMVQADLPQNQLLRQNFQHIISAGEKARDIVNQILTFSRKTSVELEPQPLHGLILEILALQYASLSPNIEIRQDIDAKSSWVLCDKTQIHQIVLNLCNNAQHAMDDSGGVLSVSLKAVEQISEATQTKDSMLELCISDTGHGMDPETIDQIFDPFFTTKAVGVGTGLGLSVIHGIVEMMGGDISVTSEVAKGTTFSILFPVVEDVEDIHPTPKAIASMDDFKMSILLVDDDTSIREVTQTILRRKGFTVESASDGQKAFDLFKANPNKYNLIVTDLSMPIMSGIELCQAIRASGSDIPIMLSTGQLDIEDQQEYANIGITTSIQKPWTAEELIAQIQEIDNK